MLILVRGIDKNEHNDRQYVIILLIFMTLLLLIFYCSVNKLSI